MLSELSAISPIDGRYRGRVAELAPYVSEYALMGYRVRVETEYLIALSEFKGLGLREFTKAEIDFLRQLPIEVEKDAAVIKALEEKGYEGIPATNHDVKAAEYYIRHKLRGTSLEDVSEWVHFALTSEDVNNISYALMLRDACERVLSPTLEKLTGELNSLATEYAALPMLARTHGQPASPTTFGKEMRVFVGRLERELAKLRSFTILAKLNGATGNFNAHLAAAPQIDWIAFSRSFIERASASGKHIRFACNLATTQIEPHDSYAELFQLFARINSILTGFNQDMWRYISDGWVTQKAAPGEVGSSTMPHKVNPIDFENSEGNLGVANALFEHFSRKLPISRLQRDLSDSTVKRTFGMALAHSLIGYKALLRGLGKISVNEVAMRKALNAHPEILAEAIQTVLRREGAAGAYEKLKEITRGKDVTLEDLRAFIKTLEIGKSAKRELLALTPESYIGLAAGIAKGE